MHKAKSSDHNSNSNSNTTHIISVLSYEQNEILHSNTESSRVKNIAQYQFKALIL